MTILFIALLNLNLAFGDTGDTGDTGGIVDTGDTATDTGVDDSGDSGSDSGDSADSGDTDTSATTDSGRDTSSDSDTGEGIISAAALAGEKGGFGCAAVGAGGVFALWISAMVTGLRREEYDAHEIGPNG